MTIRRFFRLILPPLVPFLALVLVAEIAVQHQWIWSYLVPPPSAVFHTIRTEWPELLALSWQTARSALIGFGLSAVVGILLAMAFSSAAWVQRAFYPYAIFFQTVPIIAIAPLLVIWLRWELVVPASAFIASVFPVIANTLSGLVSTDPALRDLFRLYGAGPFSTLWKLRLPFALPNILTGLRIAAGLAIVGAIVGEFITYTGLGGDMLVAIQQNRKDKIFAELLLASLLGILLFSAINLSSWLALRHWHPSESRGEG